MTDIQKITETFNNSPSVELLRLRNREAIIVFLINTFSNRQGAISEEKITAQLADFLDFRKIEKDEESEIEIFEKKCNEHYKFITWQNRSDGHGGVKGGTYEEYLKTLKNSLSND